jgi:hypothetical protein
MWSGASDDPAKIACEPDSSGMPTIITSESSKDEFAQQICFLFNLRLAWLLCEGKITLSAISDVWRC